MSTWTKQKLRDLSSVITKGTTPTTIGDNFVASGINFVKAESITEDGHFIKSKFAHIAEDTHQLLKRSIIHENDILYSIAGVIGRSALVTKDVLPANTNQALAIIRLDHTRVCAKFIFYSLSTSTQRALANNAVAQSVQANINLEQIGNFALLIPEMPKQKQIASFLSAYDDLIENNEKRIKVLEEMAQLLYTEWFVKFKFPGHEKVKLIDSGTEYSKIPEGWEVKNVESLIKRIPVGKKYENKNVFETGKVPVLDQGKSGFIGFHNDEPGVQASIENPVIVFANHTCYQNIIVYPFSAIQNVLPFIPNDDRSIVWLHWATKDLIKFNDYKGHWPEFMAKKLIVPTTDLTKKFGSLVGEYVAMRYKLQKENQTLSKTRDLLIPQLVTGRRELKNI